MDQETTPEANIIGLLGKKKKPGTAVNGRDEGGQPCRASQSEAERLARATNNRALKLFH
jgi:hypothetical protein